MFRPSWPFTDRSPRVAAPCTPLREVREVQIVPAVQRHRLNLLLVDGEAQLRLARLENRRRADHGGRLRERRHLQREVDHRLGVRLEDQPRALLRAETRQLDLHAVFADDRQRDEVVAALVVGHFRARRDRSWCS